MSNNAAGMNAYLDTQLRDTTDKTWTSAEKDDIIATCVADLYPRHMYQLDGTSYTQALTSGTYFYALDTAIVALSQVDLLNTDGDELGPLESGMWRTTGNFEAGTAKLNIAPTIVDNIGGTLRLYGYARYDVSSRLIPDSLRALVLAMARAECYRRVLADREKFKAWAAQSPTQNVSVNEMVQLVSEAQAEAARLNGERRTWQRPKPARV